MAELEYISGTDEGEEAIKKLDRNIKAVNLELPEEVNRHDSSPNAHPTLSNQISILFGYNGVVTTITQVIKDGYYSVGGSNDGTFPYGYGTVHLFNRGGEKTMVFYPSTKSLGIYFTFFNGSTGWQDWTGLPTQNKIDDLNTKIDNKKTLKIGSTERLPDDEIISGFSLNATQKGDGIPSVHPTIHWHNYLTFGAGSRLSQIAMQVYHGKPTLSFRGKHDNSFSDWKEVATTDKIDTLWEGNTVTLGEIQLSKPTTEGYNIFIVTSGAGSNLTSYTNDRTPDIYQLQNNTQGLNYTTVTGMGQLIGVAGDASKLELVNTGGQPLRKIVGIRRGNL